MENKLFISKLREKLRGPLPGEVTQLKMAPSYRHLLPMNEKSSDAAVMVLIYPKFGDLTTVFMKRTVYPGVHSGQISLPGGRYETTDQDLQIAALRETEEEFGVAAHTVEVLGKLTPLHIPVSRMDVYPFVGYLKSRPTFIPNPAEVERLIEIKIEDLQNASLLKTKPHQYNDFEGFIPYYDIHENHIWGATAMILAEFIAVIDEII
jgi:8-oxo-dGTP pyrophosphatase MutT (NUDIX family)